MTWRGVVIMLLALIAGFGFTSSAALQAQDDMVVLTPDFEVQFADIVVGAAWNADETQVMIWGNDPFVHVYDVATQREIFTLQQLSSEASSPYNSIGLVTFAAWSPDEAYILTTGHNYHVKLWDATTGDYVRGWLWSQPGDIANISVFWHADKRRIFVNQKESSDIVVWDVTTGEEVFTLSHPGVVVNASFNPDHTRLLVQTVPYSREEITAQIEALLPDKEEYNIDDLRLVLDEWNLPVSVYVWDTSIGELLFELLHDEMAVYTTQWSDDGSTIFTSAGINLSLIPFSSATIDTMLMAMVSGAPEPEWDELLSVFDGHSAIRRWDANTGVMMWENRQVGTMGAFDVSPDGSQLLISSINDLRILESATGLLLQIFPRSVTLLEVIWSPDMTQLYILEHGALGCLLPECDYYWLTVDIATGEIVGERIFTGAHGWYRAWNPDQTLAAWVYTENEQFFDCSDDCINAVLIMDPLGNLLARLPHNGSAKHIEWNAAGDRLLTTDADGYIRVWTIDRSQIQ